MIVLTESRDNLIHKWLMIASRQVSQSLDQQLAEIGLSASQYFYILKIHDNPGLTQKKLGETEFIDPSNVTRAVKQLITQGFVKRHPHPQDKRAYQLVLTDKGTTVYPQILQILDAEEAKLITGIKAQDSNFDQKSFVNALRTMSHIHDNSDEN